MVLHLGIGPEGLMKEQEAWSEVCLKKEGRVGVFQCKILRGVPSVKRRLENLPTRLREYEETRCPPEVVCN